MPNIIKNFLLEIPNDIDLSLILRGIFASAVVFWHVIGSAHYSELPEWLNVPGRVSVWMFFGLSGYVIAHCFYSGRYRFTFGGIRLFFIRRLARILPLFWLTSLIAIICSIYLESEFQLTFSNIAKSLTTLQWTHLTYPVGVFWTLGVELHFYLIAPLLCLAVHKSNVMVCMGVLLLIFFGGQVDDRSMLANLHFFMTGIFMAKIVVSQTYNQILLYRLVLPAFILLGAIAISLTGVFYAKDFWSYRGAILTMIAIAAFMSAHRIIEMRKIKSNGISYFFMSLGVLAYGLYAWHGVLLTLLPWFREQFVATFLVSLILAYFSYSLIEKPIINKVGALLHSPKSFV